MKSTSVNADDDPGILQQGVVGFEVAHIFIFRVRHGVGVSYAPSLSKWSMKLEILLSPRFGASQLDRRPRFAISSQTEYFPTLFMIDSALAPHPLFSFRNSYFMNFRAQTTREEAKDEKC